MSWSLSRSSMINPSALNWYICFDLWILCYELWFEQYCLTHLQDWAKKQPNRDGTLTSIGWTRNSGMRPTGMETRQERSFGCINHSLQLQLQDFVWLQLLWFVDSGPLGNCGWLIMVNNQQSIINNNDDDQWCLEWCSCQFQWWNAMQCHYGLLQLYLDLIQWVFKAGIKVWVLWVPNVIEQRNDVSFTENSVQHENVQEAKAPTQRVIQQFRERREVMLEDDESFFSTKLPGVQSSDGAANQGLRLGRGGSGTGGTGNTKAVRPSAKSGAATRASTNNTDSSRGIALEASKLKSASKTVKDIISRIGVDGMMGMTWFDDLIFDSIYVNDSWQHHDV